jgi:hypothetical protein
MKVYIVTEGKTDVAWLRWLLAPEVTEYKLGFYAGGGQSGAISMAGTILGVQLEPVVLVVDSDTTDPGRIADLEQVIRAILGRVAPESMWRLCLAVPVIESWILSEARLVKELFGVVLSSREKSRLQQNPKEAMAKLFQQAQTTYTPEAIQEVTENKDASHLREMPPVRTIRHYIEELAALSSPALR